MFGIPMGLVAAPVSLSAWYLCRAMPLAQNQRAQNRRDGARRRARDGVAVVGGGPAVVATPEPHGL